jgi:integrase
MASMETRGESYRVYWRNGGRGGRKQSVTTASSRRAKTVQSFVEERAHRVTADEVYRALFPDGDRNTDTPTLAKWFTTWVDGRVGDGIQPDTLRGYRQMAGKWIVPRLGEYQLDALNEDAVTDWVAWMKGRESRHGRIVSGTTVRHVHALLHQILAAAVPKYIPSNPAAVPRGSRRGTKGLPKQVQYEATFLEPAEADLVIAACGPEIRDLVRMALLTGLRLGELLVLRVQDVDLGEHPAVEVRRALKNDGTIGPPKSVRSRRTVTLSGKTVKLLAPLVEGRGRSALLFPAPTGRMWGKHSLERRYWSPAVAAAQRCSQQQHLPPAPPKPKHGRTRGYRLDEVSTCDCPTRLHKAPRFHDLRHSHASWMINLGEDIFALSRRLGHQDISTTTSVYGHLLRHGDGRKLSALDDLTD